MAGLYYEEFSVDQVFQHPWTRTVTEMDNVLFSALTMNVQPLEEDHAWGPPIFQGVGEYIDVHERAPRLSCAELSQFAIGLTKTECRLAGVHPCSEQLKFENGIQITEWRFGC